jgi:tetratricopeptide (TPR) repeat protein
LAARNNLGLALHDRALQIGEREPAYKLSTDIDPNKRIPAIRLRAVQAAKKAFVPDRAMMQEAVELFQGIVLTEPSYLPAQVNLGASLVALGRQGEAVKVFEQVLEADPDSAAAQVNLAVVQLATGFRDKAIQALRATLKKHPDCSDAHFNLARALAETGKADQARKHYQAYLAKDTTSGWARLARSQLAALDAPAPPKPE